MVRQTHHSVSAKQPPPGFFANPKVHGISAILLLVALGVIKFVWDHPQVILYLVLLVNAVLAYGAIYIIVKSWTQRGDGE